MEVVHLQAQHFTMKFENEHINNDLLKIDDLIKGTKRRVEDNEDRLKKLLASLEGDGGEEHFRFDSILDDVQTTAFNLDAQFEGYVLNMNTRLENANITGEGAERVK